MIETGEKSTKSKRMVTSSSHDATSVPGSSVSDVIALEKRKAGMLSIFTFVLVLLYTFKESEHEL